MFPETRCHRTPILGGAKKKMWFICAGGYDLCRQRNAQLPVCCQGDATQLHLELGCRNESLSLGEIGNPSRFPLLSITRGFWLQTLRFRSIIQVPVSGRLSSEARKKNKLFVRLLKESDLFAICQRPCLSFLFNYGLRAAFPVSDHLHVQLKAE